MTLLSKFRRIYHIEGKATFESRVVLQRIYWVLNDRDYRINTRTDNFIEFDDKSGKIKWRSSPVQLKKGSFEIAVSDNTVIVKLTYSISFITYLSLLLVFSTIAIIEDYHVFFLSVFIVISSVIDFFRLRNEAKELFLNATDENVIQPI